MAATYTLAPPVRLTGIRHRVFRDRPQPLMGFDLELAADLLRAYGRGDELQTFLDRTGNSFIAMSEALLDELPVKPGAAPNPDTASGLDTAFDLDTVLLAYRVPDLYYSEVAGCYLSQRLPGAPVPCSVAEQGPGAPFTALRIADGMCRLGELERGMLFAFDQNAAVWDADDALQSRPDAAVLIEFGSAASGSAVGSATVAELTDVRAGEPGFPSQAQVLEETLARHPDARPLIGAELAGPADPHDAAPWSTGLWAALVDLWPLREPVLLADYDSVGGVFHSCLLVPDER